MVSPEMFDYINSNIPKIWKRYFLLSRTQKTDDPHKTSNVTISL